MYLLNLQKIAWDCFNEVQKNTNDLHVRDINLRYAFKATDTFIQLYDRLERRWAKQVQASAFLCRLHPIR